MQLLLFLAFSGWRLPCLSGHYLISAQDSVLGVHLPTWGLRAHLSLPASSGSAFAPPSGLDQGDACGGMCVACEGVGGFRDVSRPVEEARWSAGKDVPEKPFPGQDLILGLRFFQPPPEQETGIFTRPNAGFVRLPFLCLHLSSHCW